MEDDYNAGADEEIGFADGLYELGVVASPYMTNAWKVEDAIQDYLQHEFVDPRQNYEDRKIKKGLKLGHHLWRHIAMGAKKHKISGCFKTFITFSLVIGERYNNTITEYHTI